jgi:DNA-binding LytR/AlgR family response regulator
MEFTIALCDDSPRQQKNTMELLAAYTAAPLSVHVFDSGADLLAAIKASRFDLYLLDILMPGLDGISLARTLREHDRDTPIIFLTSSTDYALEAFSVGAFQYLLKPLKPVELYGALDKMTAAKHKDDGFIMVKAHDHMRRVPFSSILYVEIWGRNLRFSLTDGETLESRAVRVSFASAVSPLLDDPRFLHAHKSYVLNMEQVYELRSGSFVMTGGAEIPIPRYKYTEAKNCYLNYLSTRGR